MRELGIAPRELELGMVARTRGIHGGVEFIQPSSSYVGTFNPGMGRRNRAAAWLALIGLIIPAWEIQAQIGGLKFTAGRAAITLLLLPAIAAMFQSGRRLLLPDLFVCITAIWSMGIALYANGASVFPTVAAIDLEFVGGYVVGRAFFYDAASLDTFVRVLKTLSIFALVLAVADTMSGRWIVHDMASALSGMPALSPVFRDGWIRATSSFDHPILLGVFFSIVAAILLFREESFAKRAFAVVLFLVGCFLSQSSASLMCIALIVAGYTYEQLMRSISQRWVILWALVAIALIAVVLVTEHPLGWLISHLTLDPVTGYYRILIWNAALEHISQNPIGGHIGLFNEQILDATIDSVWLVLTLEFGIPMVTLFVLTNLTAIWSSPRNARTTHQDEFLGRMRLGFSCVLLTFMFSGLTVHFWNYTWIFWGLCIGIRAALGEGASTQKSGDEQCFERLPNN